MRQLRSFGAVILGMVLANLIIYSFDWIQMTLGVGSAPDPSLVDTEYNVRYGSLIARIVMAIGWLSAAGIGAFFAFMLARSDWTGWIVAGWVAAITLFGLLGMYPHPAWIRIVAVAAPFIGATLAFGGYRRWRAAKLHLRH